MWRKMEKTVFTAIPKDDMHLDWHTWEKGEHYQMVMKDNLVTLATDEGKIHFTPEKMPELEKLFEVKHGWES